MILEKINHLAECITQDLIIYLVKEKNITKEETMDIVYNSKTFELLYNYETHLSHESSSFIYEMLIDEIEGNEI